MKYLLLPPSDVRRLSFYLAMENYVARQIDEPECFFMWQVQPSVIFGRNQVMENEVNLDYCRTHGISVFQRRSGGGCVYADINNLMLSYVTSCENVGFAFNQYINMVLLALRRMGVEAVGNRHNDIMIGNRKVGGTACQKLGRRCIVHGTLLYDTDMSHMTQAITPTQEKLQKNGVESVRQRIVLLKDVIPLSLEEVKQTLRSQLCTGELMLTAEDIARIEQSENTEIII